MFNKCNFIYSLINSLDISDIDKHNLCLEINCLINLIMFGDEKRPVVIDDIKNVHKLTRDFFNQGDVNV